MYKFIIISLLSVLQIPSIAAIEGTINSNGGSSTFGKDGEHGTITIHGKTYSPDLIRNCLQKKGIKNTNNYLINLKRNVIIVDDKEINLKDCDFK